MKMNDLEQIVWGECINRLHAPDEATVHRWETDRFAVYKEHFQIQPLPSRYERLLEEALNEWAGNESIFLRQSRMNAEEFDSGFSLLRQGFLVREAKTMEKIGDLGDVAHGAVRNMDTVNCFACFLPHAVPERRLALAQTGRRIAAIFYLEKMAKSMLWGVDRMAQTLEQIDAAWRYADELTGNL